MNQPRLDRRTLLLAGAGTVALAPLMSFEPASAAQRSQTKVFRGHFRDPNGPDWVYLPVQVPKGVREIEVSYDYKPQDTGVGISYNVVDIGIFDPSGTALGDAAGFRGWSGGARRSFRISRTSATPGYLAGPITPGRWHVALGPYQIVGGGTPYAVRVTLHYGRPGRAFEPDPAPLSVPGRGEGWYRGDLHIHTVYSDGSQTPAQVLDFATANGLDFIGTSEHNTDSATRVWGRYLAGKHKDFLVISGEEVTTRAGHWVATGIPAGTWIDWRYRPEDDELSRFTAQVRRLGGLSIAAHPYQFGGGITWEFGYDYGDVDAVEVWNGPWSGLTGLANEKAVAGWHQLLTDGVFKPAVGNSDSHHPTQAIGTGQSVVHAERLATDALIDAYRGGHCWVTGSSAVQLDFTATLADVVARCGDHLPTPSGQSADVRLDASGVPAGSVRRCSGRAPRPTGPRRRTPPGRWRSRHRWRAGRRSCAPRSGTRAARWSR